MIPSMRLQKHVGYPRESVELVVPNTRATNPSADDYHIKVKVSKPDALQKLYSSSLHSSVLAHFLFECLSGGKCVCVRGFIVLLGFGIVFLLLELACLTYSTRYIEQIGPFV